MFHGLRTVVIYVDDVAAAKAWDATALELAPYYDTPDYVGFDVGGYELGLHPCDEKRPAGNRLVTYWGVADVPVALAQLVHHGATLAEAAKDVGGGIIVGSVTDPFGNTLGLIFNPHFGKAAPTE